MVLQPEHTSEGLSISGCPVHSLLLHCLFSLWLVYFISFLFDYFIYKRPCPFYTLCKFWRGTSSCCDICVQCRVLIWIFYYYFFFNLAELYPITCLWKTITVFGKSVYKFVAPQVTRNQPVFLRLIPISEPAIF